MSYNKLGFASGQTLKADHLNHMESGIEAIANNVQIKKIVFTNRDSMYQWLLDNDSKVIYCNVISTQNPWHVKLLVHRFVEDMSNPTDGVGFGLVQINSFNGNTLVPSSIQITDSHTTYVIDEVINIDADGTVTGEYKEPIIIPDEYWPALQIEFTVYYFAE